MPEPTDALSIHPAALRAARKRQRMTQQQLADAVRCTKDTVSRWERGKSRRVRSHLRDPLCEALRVRWEILTSPPETDGHGDTAPAGDTPLKESVGKDVRNALLLVAERYNVRPREVLELAPLLFLIVAERSLLERRRRLREIYTAISDAEERLLEHCAHLGGIVSARSTSADRQVEEEEKSIDQRDIFGRLIRYEIPAKNHVGPFVRYLRNLASGLPEDAIPFIDSFDGDTIDSYRLADDTLRECTGILEDEGRAYELLQRIRCGDIDLGECLRVRRARDEAGYREWLSDEMARVEAEDTNPFADLMAEIAVDFGADGEESAPSERRPS